MGLKYRVNILRLLKENGYSTSRIRTEQLISESALQNLRENKPISWKNIETICRLLKCQPADILIFEDDQ